MIQLMPAPAGCLAQHSVPSQQQLLKQLQHQMLQVKEQMTAAASAKYEVEQSLLQAQQHMQR